MHRILVASLFLSTVLLNAQTATKGQSAQLEARSETPNAPESSAAALPATDVYAISTARRISTGVTGPKLISEPAISLATSDFPTPNLAMQQVVLNLLVDENGTPQNVRLIKSVSPTVDARILAAVRQYRFSPAMLDDQPVPMDLNLKVNFQQR